eukprot:scaffold2583_cov140-Isochrysis_galbana.AAC.5
MHAHINDHAHSWRHIDGHIHTRHTSSGLTPRRRHARQTATELRALDMGQKKTGSTKVSTGKRTPMGVNGYRKGFSGEKERNRERVAHDQESRGFGRHQSGQDSLTGNE